MVNDDICVISYVWETLPIVHNDLKKQHLTLGGLRAQAEWKWLINHWADWRCWSQDLKIIKVVRFAHKLRTAGRLLEFVSIPGAKHGSGMMPQFRYNYKKSIICDHFMLLPSAPFGNCLVRPGGWPSKSTSSRTEVAAERRSRIELLYRIHDVEIKSFFQWPRKVIFKITSFHFIKAGYSYFSRMPRFEIYFHLVFKPFPNSHLQWSSWRKSKNGGISP